MKEIGSNYRKQGKRTEATFRRRRPIKRRDTCKDQGGGESEGGGNALIWREASQERKRKVQAGKGHLRGGSFGCVQFWAAAKIVEGKKRGG